MRGFVFGGQPCENVPMAKFLILAPDGKQHSVLLEPTDRRESWNQLLRTSLAEVEQILPTDALRRLTDAGLIVAERDVQRFLGILTTARRNHDLDTYRFELEP
jgi:hypothetical protein